jgi:hypothetical protein
LPLQRATATSPFAAAIGAAAPNVAAYRWQTFARGEHRGLRPLPIEGSGAGFGGSAAETSTTISFLWAAQPPIAVSGISEQRDDDGEADNADDIGEEHGRRDEVAQQIVFQGDNRNQHGGGHTGLQDADVAFEAA